MNSTDKEYFLRLFRENKKNYFPAIVIFEKHPEHPSFHLLYGDNIFTQFIFFIRKTRKLPPNKGYIFISNNVMLVGAYTIREIYEKYKSADDFLYITICEENMFG